MPVRFLNIKSVVLLGLLPFALTGCSKSDSDSPKLGEFGDYTAKIETVIKRDGWKGTCTSRELPLRKKLSNLVDKKAGIIRDYLEEIRRQPDQPSFKVGPLFVLEDAVETPSTKWEAWPLSWQGLDQAISDTVMKPKNWTKLSKHVSRLLMQDSERIIDVNGYVLNYDTLSIYEAAFKVVETCAPLMQCPRDALAKYENVLTLDDWYVKKFEALKSDDAKVRNEAMKKTRNGLNWDLSDHRFNQHKNVRRVAQDLIEVSIDAGDLKGNEAELARLLEERWKSPGLNVKVKWTTRTADPEAYQIKFFPDKNFAASVKYKSKMIRLGAIVSRNTLTHEFGHVLGFPDKYFTIYSYDKCQYEEYSLGTDVMSDHDGQVTAEEWAELNQNYPWGSAPVAQR